jgi:hypothetical protein
VSVGLWVGTAATLPLPVLVLVVVCMWAFGCMFVAMTWAVEATSFIEAGNPATTTRMRASKPHVAALGRLAFDDHDVSRAVAAERDMRDERVLHSSYRVRLPWNTAFVVSLASSPTIALALADELATPQPYPALALTAVVVLLGLITVASIPRATALALVSSAGLVIAPVALSVVGGLARPWVAVFPSAVIVGIYWSFRFSSYSSLLTALNDVVVSIRTSATKILFKVFTVVVGRDTLDLLVRRQAGKSSDDS